MSKLFGIDLLKILITLIFQEILPSFGVVGIFRCPHGSEIIYIPLGGSKGSKLMQVRNVFIIL
jgi:hypothetical protein